MVVQRDKHGNVIHDRDARGGAAQTPGAKKREHNIASGPTVTANKAPARRKQVPNPSADRDTVKMSPSADALGEKTRVIGKNDREDNTRRLDQQPANKYAGMDDDPFADGNTRVVRSSDDQLSVSADEASSEDYMLEPVVGWVVVIEGPGQGKSFQLSAGRNAIGRSSDQKVALEFNDLQISRKNHAVITYDPRGQRFYLQGGDGKNLTYVGPDEEPVLTPVPLEAHTNITLGTTKLRFVPFCTENFAWKVQ